MEVRTSRELSYRFAQEEPREQRCIDCGRFEEEHPVIVFTNTTEDLNGFHMGRNPHEMTVSDGKVYFLGYEMSSMIRCEEFNKEIQLELF